MKKIGVSIVLASFVLSGCATPPEQIQSDFVPVTQYSNLSCNQLNQEAIRVNRELSEATGRQQQAANNDAAMTAVSLILFWPAVFFIDGNSNAPQLSRLKGEAEAISAAAQQKGC